MDFTLRSVDPLSLFLEQFTTLEGAIVLIAMSKWRWLGWSESLPSDEAYDRTRVVYGFGAFWCVEVERIWSEARDPVTAVRYFVAV